MLRHTLHTLLALTFTLLQCAAPLVHAHVDGQLSGLLPPTFETQHHTTEQFVHTHDALEENESAAITLPHEFQRDNQPVLDHPAAIHIPGIPPALGIQIVAAATASPNIQPRYNKSHPQAPPALS
jgi:hypothetical protein